MKAESQIKQEQIVEAAIKRFSHFGINKTSLTEVAEDLAISKQVLSYYFNDKQSLIYAVIDKLAIDYSSRLKKEMDQSHSIEEALLKLTEVKGIFFEKYFLLLSQSEQLELVKNQSYNTWRKFLAENESGLLIQLFETGVKTGELRPMDARKTADLLLETLYAFSRCVSTKGAIPDAEAFHQLLLKQREVIKLFYQGLKDRTTMN